MQPRFYNFIYIYIFNHGLILHITKNRYFQTCESHRVRVAVCPHQGIDVFRFVYEHTDFLRVPAEDRLDKRRLEGSRGGGGEEKSHELKQKHST